MIISQYLTINNNMLNIASSISINIGCKDGLGKWSKFPHGHSLYLGYKVLNNMCCMNLHNIKYNDKLIKIGRVL